MTVWLRLNMLEQAEALSEKGLMELRAIKRRREHLDRPVEDRDFFGAYMYKPRVVGGNPEPIIEQPAEDRLVIARGLVHSPDEEQRQGWWAFCRTDPQGAFDALRRDEVTPENGVLWNQFLNGLAHGHEATKEIREGLAVDAFMHLRGTAVELLQPMITGLADLVSSDASTAVPELEAWLQRLWELVAEGHGQPVDLTQDLLNTTINSAPGKVVETLVRELSSKRQAGTDPTAIELQLLAQIASQDGRAGQLGRAVLAGDIGFLLPLPSNSWKDALRARMVRCDDEGRALRAVMLNHGRLTPAVSVFLKDAVIQGAMESRVSEHQATGVAAKILTAALADVQGRSAGWGLSASEVMTILRDGPVAIRSGALRALLNSLRRSESSAESTWKELIEPLLAEVWPPESKALDHSTTQGFIDLVAATGEEFPKALSQLRHHILPFEESRGTLHAVKSSGVAKRFPRETLDLVWLACGPSSQRRLFDMPDIVDQIVEAEPLLKTDRRLQWLELHAERLG